PLQHSTTNGHMSALCIHCLDRGQECPLLVIPRPPSSFHELAMDRCNTQNFTITVSNTLSSITLSKPRSGPYIGEAAVLVFLPRRKVSQEIRASSLNYRESWLRLNRQIRSAATYHPNSFLMKRNQ